VRSAVVLGAEMREDGRLKLHTVYRLAARVGPFESTTYRRFSDFVKLHAALKREMPHYRMPRSAQRMLDARLRPTAGPSPSALDKALGPKASKALGPLEKTLRPPGPEVRLRLLQRYCEDLVTLPELAQAEATLAFFWPSSALGDGALVAPDGSKAAMT